MKSCNEHCIHDLLSTSHQPESELQVGKYMLLIILPQFYKDFHFYFIHRILLILNKPKMNTIKIKLRGNHLHIRKLFYRRASSGITANDTINLPGTLIRTMLLFTLLEMNIQQTKSQEIVRSTYTYKTIGDLRIHADVYQKPDDKIHPAVFWIHGGALIMGSRWGLNQDQAEKYLNAGYTVISIDYRLAPQVKAKEIFEDIRDAYRWVQTEGLKLFRIDPDRIAVVGHSAGGYLALSAGFILKPSPRAIVSFYGYGDVAREWYSQPDPFYNRQPTVTKEEAYQTVGSRVISEDHYGNRERFYLYCRQQGLWPQEVVGFDPDKEPKLFDLFCPLRNVTKTYPPTLLLHGDHDTDVPYEQSVMMAEELERNGVQHELITMPGRGHVFDRAMGDPEIVATFDRVIQFLDLWMKP
jgi:acetyl esterase/lipase